MTFYGITGTELEWFTSFLNDRRQCVNYKAFKSILKCVLYGVPQGNVIILRVLFQLYINDVSNCFDFVKCVLYAGDTNLFVESETISGFYTLGHRAIATSNDWFLANRLALNKK